MSVSEAIGAATAPEPGDDARRSEQLQAALNLIDEGFTLIDENLRLVAWNASFMELLEFPPTLAYPGAPFEGFIRYNAERGEYGPGEIGNQVMDRVASALRFESHDFERTRPDGRILRIRGVPVPEVGFITLYSDVTARRTAERQIREHAAELERRVAERTAELRQSEARVRLITDSIPALVAYFDRNRAYNYMNRGYQEWFGLDPANPGQASARQYLGDATYESIRPNVLAALAGEAVSFEYEARGVGGRTRVARTTLIPEIDADGSVAGCFELTFDVSEQRRAQQRLAQTEKMEALGQLTGGLAHDFNNMLTVIIGNLTALRDLGPGIPIRSPSATPPTSAPAVDGDGEHRIDDGLSAPAGEVVDQEAGLLDFIDPALAAARRGAELTHSLLGFARRQPLKAEAADIGPLVATVVKLLRRSLPEGVGLAAETGAGIGPDGLVDPGSPADGLSAWVDPSLVQDALVNLILNARDARARTVRVRTTAATLGAARAGELQTRPGDYVRIDVIDDGDGMNEATRARIFEPFFTTKGQGSGTGLGLSMVYGMVRQSEGAIEIDSLPGRGTTVSLWLPEAEIGHTRRPVRPPSGVERLVDHALALLVEDDPAVRRVVRRSLVSMGFAVIEAGNGAEAIQMIDQMPQIELLLSDIVMPGGVDGHAVARHARERRIPHIALMSGYAPQTDAAVTQETPILPKPFTMRQLLEFLRREIRIAQS